MNWNRSKLIPRKYRHKYKFHTIVSEFALVFKKYNNKTFCHQVKQGNTGMEEKPHSSFHPANPYVTVSPF